MIHIHDLSGLSTQHRAVDAPIIPLSLRIIPGVMLEIEGDLVPDGRQAIRFAEIKVMEGVGLARLGRHRKGAALGGQSEIVDVGVGPDGGSPEKEVVAFGVQFEESSGAWIDVAGNGAGQVRPPGAVGVGRVSVDVGIVPNSNFHLKADPGAVGAGGQHVEAPAIILIIRWPATELGVIQDLGHGLFEVDGGAPGATHSPP